MPLPNIEAQIQVLIILLYDIIFKTGKIVESIHGQNGEMYVLIIYLFLNPQLCFSLNSY